MEGKQKGEEKEAVGVLFLFGVGETGGYDVKFLQYICAFQSIIEMYYHFITEYLVQNIESSAENIPT